MDMTRVIRGQGALLTACLLSFTLPVAAQQAQVSPAADGLQAALRATVQLNPQVAGKQAAVQAREHSADAARSQRYPTLTAMAQQYSGDNRDRTTGEDLSNPASLRARQPLWAFGRIDTSIAAADADVAVERVDLLRVYRQLLEQTAVAYANVLGSRQRLQVMAANLIAHQELHAQILRREQGQLASAADVRLAATRLAQAEARVERYRGELEVAQSDLQALTQIELPAETPVAEGLVEVGDNVLERALSNSAEVRVRRESIERAQAGVNQARTASMPTLYLQAEQDYDQPSYRDDTRISVVFEGSLDGMGLATRGRTRAALAQENAAQAELAHSINEVERTVRRLQRNRQLQDDLIRVQQESLAELEGVLASYQRQYAAGTKSWLDVLNIQRELSEQQLALVQAQSERTIYSLQLAALTGGLDALVALNAQEF